VARQSSEPASAASAAEFRPYRHFLAWLITVVCGLGGAYLYVSIGVTIWQRRHPAPAEHPALGNEPGEQACLDEVHELLRGLEKHLESFHTLFDHYDAQLAQDWADEGDRWRADWRLAGARCRLPQSLGGRLGKNIESLAGVYLELGEVEALFTSEAKRFGTEQAPRLDRVRKRLEAVTNRMSRSP